MPVPSSDKKVQEEQDYLFFCLIPYVLIGHDMALPGKKSIMPGESANRKMFRRQDTPRTLDSPPQLRLRALKKASISSGDHKFMMPPSISIECAADDHHLYRIHI